MKKAEYLELLKPIVAQYSQHDYSFWRSRVDGDPITFQDMTTEGIEYQLEINAFWDNNPNGHIRVLFAIDDGGWRAWMPVCDDFIIGPDGKVVEE